MCDDGTDEFFDVGGFADVRCHAERIAAGAFQLIDCLDDHVGAAPADRDFCTFLRKLEYGGLADSIGASCDNRNFVF